MIRRKRADTMVYRLYCDECNEQMKFEGDKTTETPPRFRHVCPNGHTTQITGKHYPMIDYVELEEEFSENVQQTKQ